MSLPYRLFTGTHVLKLDRDDNYKLRLRWAPADSDGKPTDKFVSPSQGSWYKDKCEAYEEILESVLGLNCEHEYFAVDPGTEQVLRCAKCDHLKLREKSHV